MNGGDRTALHDAPPPLGTTDRSRSVKVKRLEDVEQPAVRDWIENAGRVAGWT